MKKWFKKIFKSDLEGRKLGYETEDAMWDNTICVISLPPDAGWFATRLKDKTWIVWNDANITPQSISFSSWNNAILYLWDKFNELGYPLDNWNPGDYEKEDNLLLNEPNLLKYKDR